MSGRRDDGPSRRVDFETQIDAAPWTASQKWSALFGGLAMLIDGFDNQLLGIAAPAIARDWHVPVAALAPALSIGLVGMLLGNAAGGAIGDRIGRKRALLASIALFGVFTCLVAAVNGLWPLFLCRFMAGIGIGAAVPNASALVAEITPRRKRTLIVTISTLGSPLGGLAAGLVASMLLGTVSWRWLFVCGGVAPVVHIIASSFFLLESPQFLAAHPARAARLRRTLAIMGLVAVDQAPALDKPEPGAAAPETRRILLAPAWRRDTAQLVAASFTNMTAIFLMLNWLPATLTGAGISLPMASLALSGAAMGGIAGSLATAWLINRIGSRIVLAIMPVVGAMVAFCIAIVAFQHAFPIGLLIALVGAQAFFGNALNIALFPLTLHIYPAGVRAFALGMVLSIGRIGAVISPFLAVALVRELGAPGLFIGYGALLLLAAAAVVSIGRQIQPVSKASG